MLLAYYSLYGKIVCTYEPVLTKHFYHGRTEGMRTATPLAARLCRIWTDRSSTKNDKLDALKKATVEHSRLVKESAAGKGVDRHLFALKCIAQRHDMDMPAFFQSKPYKTLNHSVLSTSNCGNPALRLFGFGPVVPEGLGIGYIIKDNAIQYSVSSKHLQTQRYVHTLEKTLREMQMLLKTDSFVVVNGIQTPDLERNTSLTQVPAPLPELNNDGDDDNDAYADIWGENAAADDGDGQKATTTTKKKTKFSRYFPFVKRGKSFRQSRLSVVGRNVDLTSGELHVKEDD
mmetsp:Transcript_13263/g.30873  ORF Transcript_13263/g.30873 Transcript_13263/m.30873 type:complete len:288 (+) Transcript_13263:3-866(+)